MQSIQKIARPLAKVTEASVRVPFLSSANEQYHAPLWPGPYRRCGGPISSQLLRIQSLPAAMTCGCMRLAATPRSGMRPSLSN